MSGKLIQTGQESQNAVDSPKAGEEEDEGEVDPLASMMGFGGFGTTKVSSSILSYEKVRQS